MIEHAPPPTYDVADDLGRAISPYFTTQDITTDQPEQGYIRYRGTFIGDLVDTFDSIREQFEHRGYTPMIREDENGEPILLAMPQVFHATPSKWWINLLLFIATIFTTLMVGAQELYASAETFGEMFSLMFSAGIMEFIRAGLPFSFSILLILGAHELGHYFAARYHNVNVTLPFFIPVPPPFILGTMGAVILQKEPPKNKRVLFDVGAAGPLAGLVFAIPILLYGLATSDVNVSTGGGLLEGNSIIYLLAKYIIHGDLFINRGAGRPDVFLNAYAWAGWCGLLVTSLNLLPVGQLDGGHMAYVLFGKNARKFFAPVILFLGLVSIIFQTGAWFLWIAMLFFFARSHAQPLDDITPLDPRRRAIAIAVLVLFFLIFTPIPWRIDLGTDVNLFF